MNGKLISNILVGFVALQHFGFLVLEMFLWTKPIGMRIFNLTPELAEQTVALAANQGLYNGFLAAGLIWGLMKKDEGYSTKVFFLTCLVIAGIFGGATAKPSILLVQGVPAFLALTLVILSKRTSSD